MPAHQLDDSVAVSFRQDNPKSRGSKAHERYERYKAAATVGEAVGLGASKGDVANDVKKGFCTVLSAAGGAPAAAPPPALPEPSAACRKRAAAAAAEGPVAKRREASAVPGGPATGAAVCAAAAPAAAPAAAVGGAAVEEEARRGESAPAAAIAGAVAAAATPAARWSLDQVDLSFVKMDGKPPKYQKRTMAEARRLLCPEGVSEGQKCGYEFALRDRDNLSKWLVTLRDLNSDGSLAKELAKRKLEVSVDLEIALPDGFPLEPPFARVVYPQLQGGYVFSHGGICFEPLTVKGWVPSMTLPALAIAIKGILDFGDVKFAGEGDVKTRTVPGYTEDGARKDSE
ncbi:unnamed protein product [Prorocentrum cordatum]|uniref:UBC core domain-containing protein n=1 Tax=Prorocentrum cordatum TaxID=2364126 RepID=A0ABN9UT36_9DINO|nr:unnamed protein product [Polarella glacialis]